MTWRGDTTEPVPLQSLRQGVIWGFVDRVCCVRRRRVRAAELMCRRSLAPGAGAHCDTVKQEQNGSGEYPRGYPNCGQLASTDPLCAGDSPFPLIRGLGERGWGSRGRRSKSCRPDQRAYLLFGVDLSGLGTARSWGPAGAEEGRQRVARRRDRGGVGTPGRVLVCQAQD
jgi:hypothetical protein